MEDETSAGPVRHGCLTAYLVFLIAANAIASLIYAGIILFKWPLASRYPEWSYCVLLVACLVDAVCAIALFRNKRWGFWGCALMSVGVALFNLEMGVRPVLVATGLFGLVLLFILLQTGTPRTWSTLR